MKYFKAALLGFLSGIFVFGCCSRMPSPEVEAGFGDNRVLPQYYHSIVRIEINNIDGEPINCSGFAISNDSIITAAHFCSSVVNEEEMKVVSVNEERELVESFGFRVDRYHNLVDLCVIKKENHGLVPLAIVEDYKENVKIGMFARALGGPQGFFPSDTTGKVISPKFDQPGYSFSKMLIASAPISRGSSGGPLLNGKDQVIGVIVMGNINYPNLSIAVRASVLRKFLEEEDEE